MKKVLVLKSMMVVLMTLLSINSYADEETVITLTEAGTLKEALSEVEATKIKHLTLKGPIDANDIKLIRAQEGRLSTLEVLDLKDVTELVPREQVYYYSLGQGQDGVLGGVAHYVCIGERDTTITVEYAYGTRAYVYDYQNDLAFAFTKMPLKRVVWPSFLNEIGWCAFQDCKQLEEVVSPTNPKHIGAGAFAGCSDLRNIPTLKDVTDMGKQAFDGCVALTALTDNHEIDLSSLDTIPAAAFMDCKQIQSVLFSPNVGAIYKEAFYNCAGIRNIDIPNNRVAIWQYAFQGCTSLANVTIPEDLINIQYTAFIGTPWYENLEFVDGIKYINQVAMESARGITNLTFRDGTISIADNFNAGSSITNVSLPTTLIRIGENALGNIQATSITLPSSLKTIEKGAFGGSSFTSIDFPESLEDIGERAFYECKQMTEATFSPSVKKVGKEAFYGCALETLTLPSSIEEIGDDAFSRNTSLLWVSYNVPNVEGVGIFRYCSSLERITFKENVKVVPTSICYDCSNLMKVTFSEGIEEISNYAFCKCKSLKKILLPNTLKKIGNEALNGCSLETISLPESLEEIGPGMCSSSTTLKSVYYNVPNAKVNSEWGAFERCTALESVTFGEQVRVIPSYTFRLCSALKDVLLSEGLEEIGRSAFSECASLTSITIPCSVTAIGEHAFSDCTNLITVTINSNAVVSKSYRNPELSAAYIGLKTIFGYKVQEYILGEDVKSIGEMAFCDCDALTSVTIPNSVKTINEGAFQGCRRLTFVEIPNSVTSIGECAFWGCSGLTSVSIPNSVTSIGDGAFKSCSGLTSMMIPNSVTSIGDGAFKDCYGLTFVDIPNSVTSIGKWAFESCGSLTSLVIPNSITSIADGTFSDCNGLTSVEIPSSVTSIDDYAFRYCSSLTSLTIPKSVTYIGIQAFSGCRERTDVYCYPKDVPETDNYVFARYGSDLEGMTLHVPANSIEAYKTAKQWKDFGKIVPLNDEPIIAGDVTGNGSVNVQDATIVVNYILGTEINDEYDYSVADMNEDGEIDVFDVTKMIAIILIEESSAKLRKAMSVQEPTIVEQLTMENVADGIALHVDNVNRFTSFQMDVEVPNGNSLTGVRPANNESGHIIRYAKIGENLYRVMALSMSSTPLKASANGLLELDLTNGEDVQIDNILFVTPKGEAVQFGALSDNIVTDIKSVGTSDAEEIYDLSGRKMNVRREQLPRGIYIINQKKVVIK